MAVKQGIHWIAPVQMLGAWLIGISLATAHHLFYRSLNGTPALADSYSVLGSTISKQELNTAVGTAFAFLVKANLAFSLYISFVQLFWREVRSRRDTHSLTFKTLDYLYSALHNISALCHLRLWWKFPGLLLTATVAWLIPIASIITPATLSIEQTTTLSHSLQRVPNLDFRSLSFLAPMLGLGGASRNHTTASYEYNGPSQVLLVITNAVMNQGSILPISGPIAPANASWQIDFTGPALRCNNINNTFHSLVMENIHDFEVQNVYIRRYGYLAWSPTTGYWNNKTKQDLPFVSFLEHRPLSFKPMENLFGGTMLFSANPQVLFYVCLLPQLFRVSTHRAMKDSVDAPIPSWIDGKCLQCQAFESQYYVTFKYAQASAKVSVDKVVLNKSRPIHPRFEVNGPNPKFRDLNGCEHPEILHLSTEARNKCYTNPKVLQTLAYQAVVDAFGRNLLGSIYFDLVLFEIKSDSPIFKTALLNTEEMSFLRDLKGRGLFPDMGTLQDMVMYSNDSMTKGITNSNDPHIHAPLHLALEEMFQNVTISLMSSPALQPNYSSITAPPPTNVTMKSFENIYVYAAWRLWAFYGTAILLTGLTVLAGILTLFLNDASYSNNFSTVFRVARIATINTPVKSVEDLHGRDPLPRYLSQASISLRDREGSLHQLSDRDALLDTIPDVSHPQQQSIWR